MNQVIFRYFVRTTMGIILVAGLLPLTTSAGILFSDTFARTTLPGNDLDADLGGMDGQLISNGTFTADHVWLEPQDVADADDRKSSGWSAPVREDASR